ncbi:RagB/SusD family nutrient uptake outer membrane protein [Pedobacter sp. Leaf132]|uniref:RagB/SusD family nutrient uptake outer membrane protein n=1 Tax=Pedobacter sp. Leaf132 TaxID=2876557 RepID=UPI001E283F49|nr:RagB/SusD family nutrient uptake outer membrane protein [Pedobacter sp. Leaf132]
MKNKIFIGTLLIGLLSIVSCKKDFLDLAPNENITEEQAFSTMIQTENFVNNIYSVLPTAQARINSTPYDSMSDEGFATYTASAITFSGGGYGPSNITTYINVWRNSYVGIRKANIALLKLPDVPVLNPEDEETRKRLRGEVLFMRAFLYFDILKIYGRFPIIDKPRSVNDDVVLTRNSYEECVAFILKDLNDAIPLLPTTYAATNLLGRANGAMCMALKSRLLLYAASPLNSADVAAKWQAAAVASKEVIDLNQFTLYNALANKADNYKAIFNVFANNEIIWFRNQGNNKNYEQYYYPPGLSGWGNTTPTQNFVDEYQMANGLDITNPASGYDPTRPYIGREPRFYATVWYNGSISRGVNIQTYPGGNSAINGGTNNTKTGYYLRKFVDENVSLSTGSGRQAMSIWFRLAEMYINYAEASNEANTSPSADPLIYTYVNVIRTRAGLPNLATGLNKEQMRLAIRHERRVELSFEEHRFFDDRRWKLRFGGDIKAINWNAAGTSYTISVAQNRPFEEKMWYMPIPQSEVDVTKVAQNPGWQ